MSKTRKERRAVPTPTNHPSAQRDAKQASPAARAPAAGAPPAGHVAAQCHACAHGQATPWYISATQRRMLDAGKLACPRCKRSNVSRRELTEEQIAQLNRSGLERRLADQAEEIQRLKRLVAGEQRVTEALPSVDVDGGDGDDIDEAALDAEEADELATKKHLAELAADATEKAAANAKAAAAAKKNGNGKDATLKPGQHHA